MTFITQLTIILVTTFLLEKTAQKLALPGVVGQLFAGILLGAGGLHLLTNTETIANFSEIGVILLMFLAGLESNLATLTRYLKPALCVAGLGILLPIVGAVGVGSFFGLSQTEAFFCGLILAATSVSISIAVLKELNLVDSEAGATILGAAVIDDLAVVLIFSLSLSLLQGSLDVANLSLTFGKQSIYLVGVFLLMKKGQPLIKRLLKKYPLAPLASISLAMISCFGLAYLAELSGMSRVIGAFFAGLILGKVDTQHHLEKGIEGIALPIFVPVFFVSVGLEVTFQPIITQTGFILLFVLVGVASKLVGGFLGSRLTGFSKASAWLVGAGMVSRGEMALIMLKEGAESGLVATDYYASLVLIILLVTLISPFILKYFGTRAPSF